jgi:phosphoribosylanthranilate isomerase
VLWVKICGVRREEDALAAAEAGADAIGINFARESPRYLAPGAARQVAEAVRGRLSVVGVFVNATSEEIRRVDAQVGLDRIQLHGEEPPSLLAEFAPRAYKAFRIARREDLSALAVYGGPFYLLDAHTPLARGGTGVVGDWSLAREAARFGKIVVAGGLTPETVAAAIRAAEPFGVDVASGVESAPGVKDARRIAAFVAAARAV